MLHRGVPDDFRVRPWCSNLDRRLGEFPLGPSCRDELAEQTSGKSQLIATDQGAIRAEENGQEGEAASPLRFA